MSVARWPILSRCFSTVDAVGVGRHDERGQAAVAGVACRSRRTRSATTAWPALVMNIFEPLRTYSSPRRTAVVWIPETSEPAFGSVSAERAEQRLLEQRREPFALLLLGAGDQTGSAPRMLATIDGARSRSSPSRAPRRSARPRSRRGRRRRAPRERAGSSARPRAPSRSRRPDASGARRTRPPAAGSRCSANSCASSRSAFCSSVSAKEMPVPIASAVAISPID